MRMARAFSPFCGRRISDYAEVLDIILLVHTKLLSKRVELLRVILNTQAILCSTLSLAYRGMKGLKIYNSSATLVACQYIQAIALHIVGISIFASRPRKSAAQRFLIHLLLEKITSKARLDLSSHPLDFKYAGGISSSDRGAKSTTESMLEAAANTVQYRSHDYFRCQTQRRRPDQDPCVTKDCVQFPRELPGFATCINLSLTTMKPQTSFRPVYSRSTPASLQSGTIQKHSQRGTDTLDLQYLALLVSARTTDSRKHRWQSGLRIGRSVTVTLDCICQDCDQKSHIPHRSVWSLRLLVQS